MKGYFNSYIKRRPFKTKWPIYYEQLTELLTGKMARGDYASIIKEALNEDLVWNWGNINLNLSNYNNKDSEDPNIPRSIVKWSPSSTLINSWSPTSTPGILTPLTPLTPSRSSLVSLLILLSSVSQSPLPTPGVMEKRARNTKKVKRLELIKRLTKNAAKAAN